MSLTSDPIAQRPAPAPAPRSRPGPVAAEGGPAPSGLRRPIRQLPVPGMVAVWAAAAGPMAVLSWVVAPRLAPSLGELGLGKALVITLASGLVWQFVLVMALVAREQGSLRWPVVRDALWLRSPRSPRTGRVGGRLWLVILPLTVVFVAEMLVPSFGAPADRDLGFILDSAAGRAWLHGAWGWYGLMVVLWLFNTVLGEELLFRGYLLPRMEGRFGRWSWLANGIAFGCYHLHEPWVIPSAALDSFSLAWPSRRYRSAWLGIAVHSTQSVFFALLVGALVVR